MNFVFPAILVVSALAISSIGGTDARKEEKTVPQQSERSGDRNPDLAWVDPIITGPVSEEYRRIREKAGCDHAKWPDIPAVCFPD